jgi:hypothetical protein
LLIPAPADPTMPTAPIRIIGVWVMMHVAAVTGIIAPAPSPGGAGMGGKSDEHQRKPAHRNKQCRKPFHRTPPSFCGPLLRACENRKAARVLIPLRRSENRLL